MNRWEISMPAGLFLPAQPCRPYIALCKASFRLWSGLGSARKLADEDFFRKGTSVMGGFPWNQLLYLVGVPRLGRPTMTAGWLHGFVGRLQKGKGTTEGPRPDWKINLSFSQLQPAISFGRSEELGFSFSMRWFDYQQQCIWMYTKVCVFVMIGSLKKHVSTWLEPVGVWQSVTQLFPRKWSQRKPMRCLHRSEMWHAIRKGCWMWFEHWLNY